MPKSTFRRFTSQPEARREIPGLSFLRTSMSDAQGVSHPLQGLLQQRSWTAEIEPHKTVSIKFPPIRQPHAGYFEEPCRVGKAGSPTRAAASWILETSLCVFSMAVRARPRSTAGAAAGRSRAERSSR